MNQNTTSRIPTATFWVVMLGSMSNQYTNNYQLTADDWAISFCMAISASMAVSIFKELLLDKPADWTHKTHWKVFLLTAALFTINAVAAVGLEAAFPVELIYAVLSAGVTATMTRLLFLIAEEYGHLVDRWLRNEPEPATAFSYQAHQPTRQPTRQRPDEQPPYEQPPYEQPPNDDGQSYEQPPAQEDEPLVAKRMMVGSRMIEVTDPPELEQWLGILVSARDRGQLPDDSPVSERALHDLGISRWRTLYEDDGDKITPAKIMLALLHQHRFVKKLDNGQMIWTEDGMKNMPGPEQRKPPRAPRPHVPGDIEQPSSVMEVPADLGDFDDSDSYLENQDDYFVRDQPTEQGGLAEPLSFE